MNTGPRGMNGASPFISAQPERDIDSTPPARPTPSSSARIACAIWIAHVSDEAQNRLTVAAGTESGKPAARAPQRDVPHALVRGVHTAGRDVLDPVELNPRLRARGDHRLPEQVVGVLHPRGEARRAQPRP